MILPLYRKGQDDGQMRASDNGIDPAFDGITDMANSEIEELG